MGDKLYLVTAVKRSTKIRILGVIEQDLSFQEMAEDCAGVCLVFFTREGAEAYAEGVDAEIVELILMAAQIQAGEEEK